MLLHIRIYNVEVLVLFFVLKELTVYIVVRIFVINIYVRGTFLSLRKVALWEWRFVYISAKEREKKI